MSSSRFVKARFFGWLFSIITMLIIFFFSSQNALQSSQVSGGFIKIILSAFLDKFDSLSVTDKNDLIESLQFLVRKGAHFSIYLVLGTSLMTAISTYNIKNLLQFSLSAVIALIYAATDEFHQTFVSGRAGTIIDVLLDFSGAVIGILFVFCYNRLKSRGIKKMRKKELMQRLSELVSTVEKLNKKVKELKLENNELIKKVEALEFAAIQKNDEACKDISEVVEESTGFTVKTVDEVELCEDGSVEPSLCNEAFEYGAKIIGKITVESARYCDLISAADGIDLKDQLGLIMGKSEVCKNEILNIAMSELSYETKQEMINSQFNEAVEYFKSVSEQNI